MPRTAELLFIFTMLFCGRLYAQNLHIVGKIVDKESKLPISGANVSIYNNKTIIYHTFSDSLGIFRIPESISNISYIKIKSLNYDSLQVAFKSKSDDVVIFEMQSHSIELKNVIIKLKKRYRDTTTIDLSEKKFERSIMIDDIFSKDFGFTKDANGQLYYKGKPVSDITVNGSDFFGKNNLEVYRLLPALTLNDVEIIETNIDSITNTTLLRPTLKVNLKLKEKYINGKFGNANLSLGSAERFMENADLFSYKSKEQISFSINSNNINIGENSLQDPKVTFSTNGNNLTTNNTKFTYRNIFNNKLEINVEAKGKIENKSFLSESDRQEENQNIFSKIFNSSNTKSFIINDARININYRIDSLNNISVIQNFNYSNIKEFDSLNYNIKSDISTTTSQLNKLRNSITDLFNTKIEYQKRYNSKKGRLLSIKAELNNARYSVNELDNLNNTLNQNPNTYFINGWRSAKENTFTLKSSFTEPLGDSGYANFFVTYEKDNINYNTLTRSDTTINTLDVPAIITNNYLRPGIKFQKIIKRISVDFSITSIFDTRNISQLYYNDMAHFFDLNMDLKSDYKINNKKDLTVEYSDITNYPDIQMLTSLNNTFDLVSQTSGNIFLKPEEKRNIRISYNTRSSDSENINIAGEIDHFNQKFGFTVINSDNLASGNAVESTFEDNIGSSNGGQISFSFLKNLSNNEYLNYTNNIGYLESPTIINNKLILNNSITFNQSLSTSIVVIKSLLTANPLLTTSFGKYFYETSTINITTLTYSDKLSLAFKELQLNLYPLISYNHSMNNTSSFSMNGEIKKTIFKNYGTLWIQAYDIFNSFKYVNNYVGASSYESVKYSNLNRYILVGLSLKFNNMK